MYAFQMYYRRNHKMLLRWVTIGLAAIATILLVVPRIGASEAMPAARPATLNLLLSPEPVSSGQFIERDALASP